MTERELDLQREVHRRYNPLTGEWVLVSPHRSERPWQGQIETDAKAPTIAHDPNCYLCPGNIRAGGEVNPHYASTFVFDNDYAALLPDRRQAGFHIGALLHARSEAGRCRVICYSPLHNLSLGQMPVANIRHVIDTWSAEYQTLGAQPHINSVTIFENRGAMMGASNSHPHGQIWANETTPNELLKESSGQQQYLHQRGSCLLCDYAALESERGDRVVCANAQFLAVVPFWAVWPFETLVLPRAHVAALDGLDAAGRDSFAQILKALTVRYDALFKLIFPYSMGLHQRPTDGRDHPQWHLHAHFYPPLLRSATVRKFMVGYEMLAGPQRDITAEVAAARLRDTPVQS
ncbi:MAG TPA: UDP-glucose--hexose-1-phosphate uridylyltransferase [Steroidobacteraceae bacterium]|nr:UDP-glucose--hexose-1-phosphate uridylyltransferase [Steroidobacteraceae bacterium]